MEEVLASVHQLSGEVFDFFIYIYLLSSGQTIYFGEAKMAQELFQLEISSSTIIFPKICFVILFKFNVIDF